MFIANKNFGIIIKKMTNEVKNKKEILVLLDSHAILHRAFHALPADFKSNSGMPTGALYGFSSFLLRILRELKPDYIVAAYDLPAPTFRHIAYKEYKSQRKEMDPSLSAQINKSKEILKCFKIPVFEFAGFEADDILGTLTKDKRVQSLLKKKLKVIIASGDMDTLQLVEDNDIVVFTLKKGINDTTIYNEKNVYERFGFSPKLIPDYKGLRGDASDNIPGVKGIGDKTAKELIQKFGSLDDIYKILKKDEKKFEASGVKKRIIELLKTYKEEAFFSRSLAEIRRDAPINFSFDGLKKEKPLKNDVIKIFEELDFRSLVSRLNDAQNFFDCQESAVAASGVNSENASKKNNFKEILKSQKEIFWIFKNDKNGGQNVISVLKTGDIFELTPKDFEGNTLFFNKIFSSGNHYGYKTKELYHFFGTFNIIPRFDFDILVAVWLLNSELNNPDINEILRFCGLDSTIFSANFSKDIFECRKIILERLAKESLEEVFYKMETPLIKVLHNIEEAGILIDTKKFKNLSLKYGEDIKRLEQNIWKIAGEEFNVNSTKELRRIIFDKLKVSAKGIRKTEGRALSTKATELLKMKDKHPLINELISYRELAKLKSTYIDALPELIKEDKRLHTTFNQTGTVTGRLSSANPNLQNIPVKGKFGEEIRSCFVAEQGFKLVSFDYSQIELRVAAVLSGDKKMVKAFKENADIHSLTASEIFNIPMEQITQDMRKKAKTINFGILYGMGVNALKERLGITREEAEIYRDEYFADFKGIADFFKTVMEEGRETGFVKTVFGRKRYIKGLDAPQDFIRKEAERMAFNMPIQGSAADIMKLAMIKIHKELSDNKKFKDKIRMVLQIHDELLFEIKEDVLDEATKKLKNIMENAASEQIKDIAFPVEVKISDSWS